MPHRKQATVNTNDHLASGKHPTRESVSPVGLPVALAKAVASLSSGPTLPLGWWDPAEGKTGFTIAQLYKMGVGTTE